MEKQKIMTKREWIGMLLIALFVAGVFTYNAAVPVDAETGLIDCYYVDMINGKLAPAPYGYRIMGPLLASVFPDPILGAKVLIAVTYAIGGLLLAYIVGLLGCRRSEMWMAMILYVGWFETCKASAIILSVPDGFGLLFLLIAIVAILKRWDGIAMIAILVGLTANIMPIAALPVWFLTRWQTEKGWTIMYSIIPICWLMYFRLGLCDVAESTEPITHSFGIWQDFVYAMIYNQRFEWLSWKFFFAPLTILLPLFVYGVRWLTGRFLTILMLPVMALFLPTTIGPMMAAASPVLIVGACIGLNHVRLPVHWRPVLYSLIGCFHLMHIRAEWLMILIFLLPMLVQLPILSFVKGVKDD